MLAVVVAWEAQAAVVVVAAARVAAVADPRTAACEVAAVDATAVRESKATDRP